MVFEVPSPVGPTGRGPVILPVWSGEAGRGVEAMKGPRRVLWHTDPSVGDPDDDYAAAVLKALSDSWQVSLVGAVVNRRPAQERAEQFARTLAALGLRCDGAAVPVGVGARDIGREMAPVAAGAPDGSAPAPVDGRELQRQVLAEDGSLTVLVTTAATDLDWLLEQPGARERIAEVVMMGDADLRVGDAGAGPWVPGSATNNLVDRAAAGRVFERLQADAWRHVRFTVVSRWAVFAAGQVAPQELNRLAAGSKVARWLRDRVAASLDERWTAFASGQIAGRSRETFVANHLEGRDPGRGADEPIFDLVPLVPIYDALAAMAICERWWMSAQVDSRAPNVVVVGTGPDRPGVTLAAAAKARLVDLLRDGLGSGAGVGA
jgi:hypothetical protein